MPLETADRSQTEDGRKGQNRQCSGFAGAGLLRSLGVPPLLSFPKSQDKKQSRA